MQKRLRISIKSRASIAGVIVEKYLHLEFSFERVALRFALEEDLHIEIADIYLKSSIRLHCGSEERIASFEIETLKICSLRIVELENCVDLSDEIRELEILEELSMQEYSEQLDEDVEIDSIDDRIDKQLSISMIVDSFSAS